MPKTEEKWYLVPDIEIRIHESWINLVRYCQEQIPFGDIKIRIVNGQPTQLLEQKPTVRFDKRPTIPSEMSNSF